MDEVKSPLRKWRKDKALRFDVVVKLLQTTGATLSRVERGLARPDDRLEDRIVEVTGLTREDIAVPRQERRRLAGLEASRAEIGPA